MPTHGMRSALTAWARPGCVRLVMAGDRSAHCWLKGSQSCAAHAPPIKPCSTMKPSGGCSARMCVDTWHGAGGTAGKGVYTFQC